MDELRALLFEKHPNPMWMIERRRLRFLAINAAALRHYGYAREEFLAMALPDLHIKTEIARLSEHLGSLDENSDGRLESHWTHRKKDGTLCQMELTGSLIELGGKEAVLMSGRDVTERVRVQEELLQAEKMASVGMLIGGVAHELNNPLTSILGHAQLLSLEAAPGSRLSADLSVIVRETNRCIRLIKSLLGFARKREHEMLESDLNPLVSEMLELKSPDLRRAGVALRQDLAADLPRVLVDPHQIQQVLLNLLNNAEQAMEGSKGSLLVETRPQQGRVLLRVTDTGPGIAPEIVGRIFEPFFTTKEPGKGTGLGLSICARIIEGHGGSLSVDTHPGHGACFIHSVISNCAYGGRYGFMLV